MQQKARIVPDGGWTAGRGVRLRPVQSEHRNHRRPPNALGAAALSAVVPGAGQMYAGYRRRGVVLLLITAALAGGGVALWLWGRDRLASLVFQPAFLVWMLVADAALLLFRAGSVVEAYRLARRRAPRLVRRWRHVVRSAALAGLLVLTAAPHLLVGWYDVEAYRFLTAVFPRTLPVYEGAVPRSEETPLRELLSRLLAPPPSRLAARDRWTFLLLGGDAGPGRWGLRTDTIIVVTVRPAARRAAVFSIPRNLVGVPLPGAAPAGFAQPVNAIYAFGSSHPDLFPGKDPGAEAVKRAVSALLGIEVDHYALVDLDGFVGVVDALGGVTIDIRTGLSGTFSPAGEEGSWVRVDLPPGRHHVDGRTALAYVRVRQGSSDYDRMARQRCVLAALRREADVPSLLRAFPRLTGVLRANVETDIPLRLLPELVALVPKVPAARIVVESFIPPAFVLGRDAAGFPIADVAEIRAAVGRALTGSIGAAGAGGLERLGEACP